MTSDPTDIDCGKTCSYAFVKDTVVTLTANPCRIDLHRLGRGACGGTDACGVTMDAAKSVTANFAINTYTLNYAAGANGSLTGNASQTVNYGASGTAVTAVPDVGYHFVDWSDDLDGQSAHGHERDGQVSVTANFAINTYTLTYTAGTHGTLTGDDVADGELRRPTARR